MDQIFINIFYTACLYLIVSVSFNITFVSTGYFNLAHAAIITLGPYLTYSLVNWGVNLWISIFSSVIICGVLGFSLFLFIYRRLDSQGAKPLFFLICSLGVYIVIQNIVSMIFGDDTLSIRTNKIVEGHRLGNVYITSVQFFTIVLSIVLFSLSIIFMNYMKLGKLIKALSNNPALLNNFGVNVNRVRALAFLIGSLLAAIIGIMSSFETDMKPTMGFSLLLYGIVTIIIGGVGNNKSLIISALLLASAQHLGAYFIDSRWKEAIAYIILILFLIWKPLGFSGKQLKKIEI